MHESGAIALYIAEKSEALMPKDRIGRERATAWVFSALNSIETAVQELGSIIFFHKDAAWAKERRPQVEQFVRLRFQPARRRSRRQGLSRRPLHCRRPHDVGRPPHHRLDRHHQRLPHPQGLQSNAANPAPPSSARWRPKWKVSRSADRTTFRRNSLNTPVPRARIAPPTMITAFGVRDFAVVSLRSRAMRRRCQSPLLDRVEIFQRHAQRHRAPLQQGRALRAPSRCRRSVAIMPPCMKPIVLRVNRARPGGRASSGPARSRPPAGAARHG